MRLKGTIALVNTLQKSGRTKAESLNIQGTTDSAGENRAAEGFLWKQ